MKNPFKYFFHRPERRDRGVDGWPILAGTATDYPASPAFAEQLSTVLACVTAVSSAVSALPALLYQSQGKTRTEVTTGEICRLIKEGPNPYQTWPEFVEFLVAQTLLRGNGLVEIESARDGTVTGLRVIPWDWCNAQMLASGRLVYDVYDQPGIYSPAAGKRRRLLQHEVIHVRDRSDDGLIGKSRLQRAAPVIRGAWSAHNFAGSFLENALTPSALLTSEREMTAEAAGLVREKIQAAVSSSSKAGRLLFLPGGEFQFHRLTVNPEDAELLESRKFCTEEICRIFQVPPPIIQDYSHNTFTNSEQAGRWFAQFCLLPWVRKLEASFNRALFAGTDLELTMDMSAFDRGSPETRWANHAIAVSNGILAVDEVREIEGWGPKVQESDTVDIQA
ncbi:MAG: phage portal protein [Desulfovibrio sp.]|jgi:HK97 family phage portal protein|nr:phage portal protein [Desulfovibrio sp.]